jgi:hypothetical protein
MSSFVRVSGSMAAVALAGVALTAPSVARAQPHAMASAPRTFSVPCSTSALVTAINAANSFSSATIHLRAKCIYSIATAVTGSDGLPVITGDVTLLGDGWGTVIRRSSAATTPFRILDVAAAATLRLTRASVMDGSITGLGGGIQNAGTLILSRVTLSGNTAGNGGGLANLAGATAIVTGTHLTANTTTGVGGSAIINSGKLKVIRSHFSGNTAPINGGALNTQASGISRIFRSSFVGNVSGGIGGGLSNLGTTKVTGTVVRRNKGSAGGGIATGNTQVTLRRTVVRGNIPDNCSPLNTIPGCDN